MDSSAEVVIDSIFEEKDDFVDCLHEEHCTKDTVDCHLQGVSLEVIQQVTSNLAQNASFSKDKQQLFINLPKNDILERLKFLDGCLVSKSTFANAVLEKAWSNYHAAYLKNMASVTEVTNSSNASAWICLKTFQCLIHLNYSPVVQSSQPLNGIMDEEQSIIFYIGGSIVWKLNQQFLRSKDAAKASKLNCLESLLDPHQTSEKGTLTQVLDRGGLIILKKKIEPLFLYLEVVFRSMFGNNSQVDMSLKSYLHACMKNEPAVTCFYETVRNSFADDSTKVCILVSMIKLYFTVRAHHKCKVLMDERRFKNHASKKEKSLRKSLKTD